MQDALGLKISQFVALMGDRVPDIMEAQRAQRAAKAHITRMLEDYAESHHEKTTADEKTFKKV